MGAAQGSNEGADAAPSAVLFYTDEGRAYRLQSASQNLWDTDAACTELEIVHASYRED